MKLWGFYKGSGRLPSPAEVASVLPKSVTGTFAWTRPRGPYGSMPPGGTGPGGIGKGYAVDRMVDVLTQRGVQVAMVAGSDSTIYGMGAPPTEPKGWRVGIKDPRNARRRRPRCFSRTCRSPLPAATKSSSGPRDASTPISWIRARATRRKGKYPFP